MEKYFKIRINSLDPVRPIPFDLFIYINKHYVHYLKAGDILDAEKQKTFEKKANDVFYVLEEDRAKYKEYISNQLNDESLDVSTRARILRESTFSLIEEVFENPDLAASLDNAKVAVDNILGFMQTENSAMGELLGLSSHDFYTYNHSLDVCIYSIGLGQALGLQDQNEIQELGRGGFFHDIGKRYVSTDIICKKGPLDEDEWNEMKMHPTWGLQMIDEFPEATDAIRACIYEHHENFLGNGYPNGITGEEIHPKARVVAICDTYDALTTKRSYSEPMTPTQALELMNDKLKSRFDPDFMKAFYEVLFQMKK